MTELADLVIGDCLIDETIEHNNKNLAFLNSGHASLTRVGCLEGPTLRSKIRMALHSETEDNRPASEMEGDCGECSDSVQVPVICPIVDVKKCSQFDDLLERIQCSDMAAIGRLVDTIQDDWDRELDKDMLKVLVASTLGADCELGPAGTNGCDPLKIQHSTTNYHRLLPRAEVIPALSQDEILICLQVAGERSDEWDAMVMHSRTYHYLEHMNLIDPACATDCETFPGRVVGSMYGCRIIVDDYMEPISTIGFQDAVPDDEPAGSLYYPILFLMPNALVVKDGSDPKKILEMDRDPFCDVDSYISRRRWALCPHLITYDAPIENDIQSVSDVTNACNWLPALENVSSDYMHSYPYNAYVGYFPLIETTTAAEGNQLTLCPQVA